MIRFHQLTSYNFNRSMISVLSVSLSIVFLPRSVQVELHLEALALTPKSRRLHRSLFEQDLFDPDGLNREPCFQHESPPWDLYRAWTWFLQNSMVLSSNLSGIVDLAVTDFIYTLQITLRHTEKLSSIVSALFIQ